MYGWIPGAAADGPPICRCSTDGSTTATPTGLKGSTTCAAGGPIFASAPAIGRIVTSAARPHAFSPESDSRRRSDRPMLSYAGRGICVVWAVLATRVRPALCFGCNISVGTAKRNDCIGHGWVSHVINSILPPKDHRGPLRIQVKTTSEALHRTAAQADPAADRVRRMSARVAACLPGGHRLVAEI